MSPIKVARAWFWRVSVGALFLAVAGTGYGTQFDITKSSNTVVNAGSAIARYKQRAEMGDGAAQFHMGMIYLQGSGVARDDAAATEWFRKSAEQGYARAQTELGLSNLLGRGVPQNYAQAAYWLTKAAGQGDALAQENLGAMYAKGEGVQQDDRLAIEWTQKAAAQGNETAKANLAALTRPQDEKVAYNVGYLLGSYGVIVFLAGIVIAALWSALHPKRRRESKASRW
jgi:hypothetical protein